MKVLSGKIINQAGTTNMATKKGEVEVTRSFSYKLGQPNYSSVDFFCSVTDKCMRADVERIGKGLDEFCRAEVRKSIVDYYAGIKAKEDAEIKAEKDKAAGKSEKKAVKLEKKEEAKESAELEAGDVEIIQED